MRTNIVLDDNLVAKALKVSRVHTKRILSPSPLKNLSVITAALISAS